MVPRGWLLKRAFNGQHVLVISQATCGPDRRWDNDHAHTRVNRSQHNRLPTDIEGIDSLAELALDVRWSWNHATDSIWPQLAPRYESSRTTHGQSCRRSRATKSRAC